MLIIDALFHWCVRGIFLYTKLASGPQQFIIEIVFIAIPADCLITLYLPLSWIRASRRNRWAGWGTASRATPFKFVRIPDPREELLRRRYFSKRGKYLYGCKKQACNEICFEKRNIALNSVNLLCKPIDVETLSADQIENSLNGGNLSRSWDNIIEIEDFSAEKRKKFRGRRSNTSQDDQSHGYLNHVIQVKPFTTEVTIPIFESSKTNVDLQIIVHKKCDQEIGALVDGKQRQETDKKYTAAGTNKETLEDILIIVQHKDEFLDEIRNIGETKERNRIKQEDRKIEIFGVN